LHTAVPTCFAGRSLDLQNRNRPKTGFCPENATRAEKPAGFPVIAMGLLERLRCPGCEEFRKIGQTFVGFSRLKNASLS
jgi:hypothetical protein